MPKASKKGVEQGNGSTVGNDLFEVLKTPPAPPFLELLRKPLLKSALPKDFDANEEALHLEGLWPVAIKLHHYRFETFVHAGGSGMVFKVFKDDSTTPLAMKIARKKLMAAPSTSEAANALSPVSESELKALERLSHPNVVRLYDALEEPGTTRVIAICTTFVESPSSIDAYLRDTLEKDPDPKGVKGLHPFSPQRLDEACRFLLLKSQEVAAAMEHMHEQRIYHFDIKSANILISGGKHKSAVLTDMGSCIHADQVAQEQKIRVHFTWTYAHPDLTTIIHDPGSISGGGLSASASIEKRNQFEVYDLYAFGRTLQECLAILAEEFGERCHASYAFRYLHCIACLLLDGKNAPGGGSQGVTSKDGRRFVDDVTMSYPSELFGAHKIRTATELVNRLARFSREHSWSGKTPELDTSQPEMINTGYHLMTPFTKRVAAVLNHPAARRLKTEPQLGWLREVYPGATHTRWSHSLGVFASTVSIFNALLSDPEVPTFRILCDPSDIWHALVAALIHDLGQSAFGHDLEEVSPIFAHDKLTKRLLEEDHWGESLKSVLTRNWRDIDPASGVVQHLDTDRMLSILERRQNHANPRRVVDGVAADIINGPIDADKLDYLIRDSLACGVPYGQGMDPARLVSALSVSSVVEQGRGVRLALAYKAKGRPAVESMLLARYQMYGAVYWHHTFRCIQAMFSHAAILTFGAIGSASKKMRGASLNGQDIHELFYQKVILRKSWRDVSEALRRYARKTLPDPLLEEFSAPISGEPAIEFVYRFADDNTRLLLNRLLSRDLFKRVFEVRVGELGRRGDYSEIRSEFTAVKRTENAKQLQQKLLLAVDTAMRRRGTRETITENAARERLDTLRKETMPLVVIDFPVRGVASDMNLPKEIGDSYRKYLPFPNQDRPEDDNVFHSVRQLQMQMAAVRIFASREFHELIIRYLRPDEIIGCVAEVMPKVTGR
ncbi:MAG: protein kinase [Bryobacterales bacterium]|nr:protein kinase [Bryobacterales bacterium]